MLVDKQSLIDLGVLPNGAGSWPLGPLLDHTHSRPAHDALRMLLSTPLADPEELRARQQLLRQLPEALVHARWATLVTLARDVEGYLDSNYLVTPPSLVDGALFALRYRAITVWVEQRLLALSQLLELASELRNRLRPITGDAAFRDLVEGIDAVVTDPLRMRLREASHTASGRRARLGALDRRARVECRDALRQFIAALVQLDAFGSLATAANRAGWVYPEFADDDCVALEIEGVRHPLVERGVPNDVTPPVSERVMFVTGPNMAGKSTLLRAVGLVVHFAHVGLPVPASRARLPRVDRLVSSLSVDDNIVRGESLYLAEVRRVKSVVSAVAAGERVVALLDEVFRGTNVKDAIDATALLVDGLAQARAGTFVVASHLTEVAHARRDATGIGLWCVHVDVANGRHTFTYTLRPGVSEVRLGMTLLESEGVAGMLRALAPNRRLPH